MTKGFPYYDVRTLIEGDRGASPLRLVSDLLTGSTMGTLIYTVVFQEPNQPPDEAWRVFYRVPWDGRDDLEATLVRKVMRTREAWE